MGKKILITVGSTHFDQLIRVIDSTEFLDLANRMGYDEIFAQIGNYGGKIENLKTYSQYLKPDEMKKKRSEADLVIGHAGAGTIMEVLQNGKPLIVVVNDSLMENHQTELATKLGSMGLIKVFSVSKLIEGFAEGNFQSHKLTMDCSEIVDSIKNHFNFVE